MKRIRKIVLLTGGTGGVKFLLGLRRVVPEECITVIVNTGDDIIWNGLYVSPDVDTVIYALTGMLDLDKMWGVKNDTFNFLMQAEILGLQDTWFKIGDRDLAMHVLRTFLMSRGYTLTQVTKYVCHRLGIRAKILPMCDSKVTTRILTEIGEVNIQEFLVKYERRLDPIAIRYEGIEQAEATPEVVNELKEADLIIIGPSSPPVSIMPILKVKPVGEIIRKVEVPVVVISPMIGGRPICGITDKLMRALGFRGDVIGVGELYSRYATHIVIHPEDEKYIPDLTSLNLKVLMHDIVFRREEDAVNLAKFIIDAVLR